MQNTSQLSLPGLHLPRRWSALADLSARVITEVAAPQYLATLTLLTHPLRHPGTAFEHAVAAAIFTTGIPMAALAWMRHTGRTSDRHVTVRHARTPLFLVCLSSIIIGITALTKGTAPTSLIVEVGAILVGLLICMSVNLGWKLSIHSAVGTFCALILLELHVALIASALIGWSRLHLRDHTAGQVAAGTVTGVLVHYGMTLYL